jgi:hypothetical protein
MGRRFLYRRKKTRWQERRKRRRLKQKLHHQTEKTQAQEGLVGETIHGVYTQ